MGVGDISFADSCISAKVSVASYVHRNDSLLSARAVAGYYRLSVALFIVPSAIHRQCYRSEGIGGEHTMRERAQVSFQLIKSTWPPAGFIY